MTLAEQLDVDIFTIGLSDEVDSLAMAELALRNGGAYMFAERPTQLISIFGVLDLLLSDSLPSYEMVWTVNAARKHASLVGRAMIGRVTVDTGAGDIHACRSRFRSSSPEQRRVKAAREAPLAGPRSLRGCRVYSAALFSRPVVP